MAWLGQLYTVLLLVSQLVVVPGLTWLGCRDTAILLLAVTANIAAQILVATNSKVVYTGRMFCGSLIKIFTFQLIFMIIGYCLWMLWNSITTITRSAMSKYMEPSEIGKAFSVLAVVQVFCESRAMELCMMCPCASACYRWPPSPGSRSCTGRAWPACPGCTGWWWPPSTAVSSSCWSIPTAPPGPPAPRPSPPAAGRSSSSSRPRLSCSPH